MRKFLVLAITLFLVTQVSAVSVSLIDPTNYPLKSNTPFSVTISVYNDGTTKLEDYSVGVSAEYPFKEVSGETYLYKIGDIEAKKTVYKTFRFLTNDNIPQGVYNLKAYVCTGTCASKTIYPLGLQFKESANIQMVSYSFNKSRIISGDLLSLRVSLKNYGNADAEDVSINITNMVAGKVPFIFLEKPSNYFIGDLGINETRNISFTLLANENLTKNVYSLPIKIEHGGLEYSLGDVNFEVIETANLRIVSTLTEPIQVHEKEQYTLLTTIENIGRGEAKSVTAYLGGEFIGEDVSFIGSIDYEEDDIALFQIISQDKPDFTLTIRYRDDLGEHELTKELKQTIYPQKTMDYTLPLIIIMLAAVITAYLLRKRLFKKLKL